MPSDQQIKVDELRAEVMRLRSRLDACEGAVYEFARRHWLSYHEVEHFDNPGARAVIADAAAARTAWYYKNEELREAMWYLHHQPGTFRP